LETRQTAVAGAGKSVLCYWANRELELRRSDRFWYRTRYFTDSGIIGSKEFVFTNYQRFKHLFYSKHEKKPKPIKGLAYESLRLVQNPGKKQIMFISARKINTN
jgi:hypothetical protein